jgi:hypothetical protein
MTAETVPMSSFSLFKLEYDEKTINNIHALYIFWTNGGQIRDRHAKSTRILVRYGTGGVTISLKQDEGSGLRKGTSESRIVQVIDWQ